MPEAKIKARGGAKRWRRKVLPGGKKYVNVAVVPKAGPRGGHTIAGEEHMMKSATAQKMNAMKPKKRRRRA